MTLNWCFHKCLTFILSNFDRYFCYFNFWHFVYFVFKIIVICMGIYMPWSKSQSFPVLYFGGCESNLNLEFSTTSNYLHNTAPLAKCIYLFNPNSNTETIVPERWWNLFHLQFVCVLLCSIFHITTTNKWHKNVCICAIRCCHNNTVENMYNENTYQIQCVNKEGSEIILIFYSFFCVATISFWLILMSFQGIEICCQNQKNPMNYKMEQKRVVLILHLYLLIWNIPIESIIKYPKMNPDTTPLK